MSDQAPGGGKGGVGDGAEPDPGIPDVPPPADPPDIAVQLWACLDDLDIFEEGTGEKIRERIVGDLREAHPGADVRVECIDGREHIGLWRGPVPADEHVAVRHQLRDEELAAVDIVHGEEMMTFRTRTAFIRASARDQWRDLPKRYNTSGSPDDGGSVRLRYLKVGFHEPDRITTTIGMGWKIATFRVRVEDTLSLGTGLHRPVLYETAVKIRPKRSKWALAVTRGLLKVAFPHRRIDIKGQVEDGGAGAEMVEQLPTQFLIPGHDTKYEVSYQRVKVDEDHLDAGATLRFTSRSPDVTINGPPQVRARVPQAMFTAVTTDLRNPRFMWTSDGQASDPDGERTSIVLPEEPGTYQVSVTARDDDGASVHASHAVRVVGQPLGGGGGPGTGDTPGGPGAPGGGKGPGRPPAEP